MQIILLVFCCVLIVVTIVFRNTPFVKKYWKYSLILIPTIFMLALKILSMIRTRDVKPSTNLNVLKDEVLNVKEKLQEVNTVVKIEAAVEKTKNDQLMSDLKEAQKIEDNRERRKRLAELLG